MRICQSRPKAIAQQIEVWEGSVGRGNSPTKHFVLNRLQAKEHQTLAKYARIGAQQNRESVANVCNRKPEQNKAIVF